jgi:hypothetical protein
VIYPIINVPNDPLVTYADQRFDTGFDSFDKIARMRLVNDEPVLTKSMNIYNGF